MVHNKQESSLKCLNKSKDLRNWNDKVFDFNFLWTLKFNYGSITLNKQEHLSKEVSHRIIVSLLRVNWYFELLLGYVEYIAWSSFTDYVLPTSMFFMFVTGWFRESLVNNSGQLSRRRISNKNGKTADTKHWKSRWENHRPKVCVLEKSLNTANAAHNLIFHDNATRLSGFHVTFLVK